MIDSLPISPVFIDESTLRFCPASQIDRIVEAEGYTFFINEEVIHDVRCLECASWIESQLEQKRVKRHCLTRSCDIRLLTKITKSCGVCRGEVCSYVAAQRGNGIVIAQDAVARKLLLPHFPEVVALGADQFLHNHQLIAEQKILSKKQVTQFNSSRLVRLAEARM